MERLYEVHLYREPGERSLVCLVKQNGCHEVVSHKPAGNGYVIVSIEGERKYAHRLMWEHCFGPIPEGQKICHACDNTICVNPSHLFPGTQGDNVKDMMNKGRNGYYVFRGEEHSSHKLTEEQAREIKEARGLVRQAELGAKYGVSVALVSDIQLNKKWRHLSDENANRDRLKLAV